MSTAEISEQSTKEEVQAYAEQVAKEVADERSGEKPEQKSDAQIASEQAGKPAQDKTPAETNSGNDTVLEDENTAKAEDQGEELGNEIDWLDDDVKSEAAAFGISEADLADFTSRDELERALRLFDKSALEAGRKALAESEGGSEQGRNDKGQFSKKEEPESPAKRDGQYEIALNKDVYDDDIVDEFTRMRDHYESRLDALESRFREADDVAKVRHFESLVDSLGHAEIFGKTDKETPREKQRREDLWVDVQTYLVGREALGRPAELNETVVSRIARSLFAEELGKKELKQRTRKISQQSNSRQGGGATRPQDPREEPRDEFDRLYRELDRN